MKTKFLKYGLCVGAFFFFLGSAVSAPPEITITAADGRVIPLEPEDTSGITARPLVKTRDRLNERFKRQFIFLYKINVPEGLSVIGRYKVQNGPLRLTVYEITKNPNSERHLRVLVSTFRKKAEVAEFKTTVKKFQEHVFFVTAEAVQSETQLNPHLRYMNAQNNEILLKGFSTNWSLITLKFRLAEKGSAEEQEVEFTKDADWLVNNLINPQWVVSTRLE